MRACIRIDKEAIARRYPNVSPPRQWLVDWQRALPTTIISSMVGISDQFRYMVYLHGPDADVQPLVTELMDMIHGVVIEEV